MTLGSCLVSNDIPYEGLAKDIIERRVQGQSWKQIADDFNLGSPGTARKMFTKLTGVTDYKIKGNDLLKLINGKGNGFVPDIDIPKITDTPKVPTPPKSLSNTEKRVALQKLSNSMDWDAPDFSVANPGWTDLTNFQRSILAKAQAKVLTQAQLDAFDPEEIVSMYLKLNKKSDIPLPLKPWDKTPDPVQKATEAAKKATSPDYTQKAPDYKWKLTKDELPPYDEVDQALRIDVVNRAKKGQGYAIIQQAHPELTLEQIDRVVARHFLLENDLDPWKALQKKPNSITLQQEVSERVWGAIQKGISPTDLSSQWKIPKSLIDDIVQANGKWKLPLHHPLPEFVEEIDLPDYQTIISNASKATDVDIGDIPGGFGTGKGSVDTRAYPFATPEKLQAMRRRQWRGFEDPERAITNYTGSGYSEINGLLRGTYTYNSPSIKMRIANMDKGMYEVDEAFSVTRGMGIKGFGMGQIDDDIVKQLVGKVMQDKGFLSTSTRPVFSNAVRLNIEVPKGARGHWAKPISLHSSENEFILARGTRLMILGIDETSPGHYIVRARVVV